MPHKDITIYDIAKELGLSASTVSRALNENKLINEKTRNKVIAFAESVGYQTNTFAANLRSNETKTIGIIVPRLDSNFVSSCLAGAEKVASEKSYSLLISQSQEDYQKEKEKAKLMFKKRVDGLLVSLANSSKDTNHFNPYIAKGIPVLFFDRTPDNKEYSTFIIDNFEASYNATKYLINQKCKNLVHLTFKSENSVYRERINGFKAAIGENKNIIGNILHLDDLNIKSGKKAAYNFDFSNVDGVFSANDQAAAGCMIELQKQGYNIPKDIAFIGFNNDPICEVISPNLTSIDYPAFEMGTLITNHLIEHILGNSNINLTNRTILKSKLIIRESSLKL